MTASFLASFLIFIATGVYELFYGKAEFLSDEMFIHVFLYVILFLNACYYYYFAGYTEMHDGVIEKLQLATRWEWGIRVLNQTILFGLWFLLHFGWAHFAVGLVTLYLTYLLWDWITWKRFQKHFLTFLDFCGLGITVLFLFLRWNMDASGAAAEKKMYFLLGITCVLYMVILFCGVYHCRFNPFGKQYFQRPKLR
ncbi:MAG: hypothetical protein NTX50_15875 [Candidatus Sumerlaeota bacterium]|nr:hypothetical protein [Candidatus Sumerlaeota bacterium]